MLRFLGQVGETEGPTAGMVPAVGLSPAPSRLGRDTLSLKEGEARETAERSRDDEYVGQDQEDGYGTAGHGKSGPGAGGSGTRSGQGFDLLR
jgi:hypothetical protein